MSNMSYCRWQNTLADLKDCWYNFYDESLSDDEKIARELLIKLCEKISANAELNEIDNDMLMDDD